MAANQKTRTFRRVAGKAENGVAILVDKNSNCVLFTEYVGETYGVLARCMMADGIINHETIKAQLRIIIDEFVPDQWKKPMLDQLNVQFKKTFSGNHLRIDIPGVASECFIEISWISEGLVLVVKCA